MLFMNNCLRYNFNPHLLLQKKKKKKKTLTIMPILVSIGPTAEAVECHKLDTNDKERDL